MRLHGAMRHVGGESPNFLTENGIDSPIVANDGGE